MEPQSENGPQFDVLGDCRLVLFALLKDPTCMTKKKSPHFVKPTFCLPKIVPKFEVWRRHSANSKQVGKLSATPPNENALATPLDESAFYVEL